MKYLELESNLDKQIKSAYLISGSDRYLCYDALAKIKKALNIAQTDLNEVILSADSASKDDIVRAVSVFPFMDNYRLVQVNEFSNKKATKDDKLLEYLKNPMQESILVFFSLDSVEALKPYMPYLTAIDCDKLEPMQIKKFIKQSSNSQNLNITEQALDMLILFCNNNMARISSELVKLVSYANGKQITPEIVREIVSEDKEYQVFELAEFIARNEKQKALDLVFTLANEGKGGFSIIAPLYNNYRRALYVAINKDKTDEQLAVLLNVKPYAVKMVKNQIKYFTPKSLKSIVDMLYEADRNIKMGKIKEDVAIKTIVLNILKIRG